jgi:hypothetical protein
MCVCLCVIYHQNYAVTTIMLRIGLTIVCNPAIPLHFEGPRYACVVKLECFQLEVGEQNKDSKSK